MDDVNDAEDETTDVESWKPGKHFLVPTNTQLTQPTPSLLDLCVEVLNFKKVKYFLNITQRKRFNYDIRIVETP